MFILPSRTGVFFGVSLVLMLIAAINYQNNVAYALTFLLANLFVVAVLHSYANLAGLTLTAIGADDAFAGQHTAFRLRLTAGERRGHYALLVGWPVPKARLRQRLLASLLSRPQMQAMEELDLEPGEQHTLRLHLPVIARGWFHPGRLRIESVYPLGLLRCWTWVDLDQRALVFPMPLAARTTSGDDGEGRDGLQVGGSGDDEFTGIRNYREGDSPRRVYWKGVARGSDLQSKEYNRTIADTRWLDWDQFAGLATETRLSALCHEVLEHHRRELEFGLRLPGTSLVPGRGERQRDRALRALALYGIDSDGDGAR